MTNSPAARSCYLYAVVRSEDRAVSPAFIEGLAGVGGCPVRAVSERELAAVFSEVPAGDYTPDALRERLEDLPRLEELARAHHAVIDALTGRMEVLPLRLATLYHSERRVREVLRERHDAFAAVLGRVAGRREWGVKVYVAGGGAQPGEPAASGASSPRAARSADEPAPGAASGRDYLRTRLRQRREREEGHRTAVAVGARVDAELSAFAEGVRHHRPQDPRLTGEGGENVLNAAFLVARNSEDAFVAAVRALDPGDSRVRVELTGPWAPYSFTSLDPSAMHDDQPAAEQPAVDEPAADPSSAGGGAG